MCSLETTQHREVPAQREHSRSWVIVSIIGQQDEDVTDPGTALAAMRAVLAAADYRPSFLWPIGQGLWMAQLDAPDVAELDRWRYWGRDADGYSVEAFLR